MTYLCQVAIPYFSGDADDVIVNTFHVDWAGGGAITTGDYVNLRDRLITFYETAYNGEPSGPGLHFAPWVNIANVRFTVYDLDDPTPRVPVYDVYDAFDLSQPVNSSMPLEVACVVSYRANYQSGVARARQRGRIYLGGFSANGMLVGTASNFPAFSSDMTNQIGIAAGNLLTNLISDDWVWVVYSRTGDASYPIVAGWVDTEFDTQRRRGNVNAGARDPWT